MYEENSGRAPSQCNNEAARIVFVSNLHCFIQAWSPFRRKSELRYPLSSNSLTHRAFAAVESVRSFLREMNFPCAKYHSSRRAEAGRIWKMRESSMKLHYRSRRNFSADTINAFDVREYHVGHDQSPKSSYPLFSNSLTIVRLPRRKRKIVLTWNEFSFARNIIPRDEQRRTEYGKCENRVWNCIIDQEETSLPIQLMRSTWENTT